MFINIIHHLKHIYLFSLIILYIDQKIVVLYYIIIIVLFMLLFLIYKHYKYTS